MPPLGWECQPEGKPSNERRDPCRDQAHPDVNQKIPLPLARSPWPTVSRHTALPDIQPQKNRTLRQESSGGSPSFGWSKTRSGLALSPASRGQAARNRYQLFHPMGRNGPLYKAGELNALYPWRLSRELPEAVDKYTTLAGWLVERALIAQAAAPNIARLGLRLGRTARRGYQVAPTIQAA